jgi:hypothetical protein
MSGHVTTNDGGAAPSTGAEGGTRASALGSEADLMHQHGDAAPSTAAEGGAGASALGSEADLMHQHGGAAPDVIPTPGVPQSSPDAITGGIPAQGGFVRGR